MYTYIVMCSLYGYYFHYTTQVIYFRHSVNVKFCPGQSFVKPKPEPVIVRTISFYIRENIHNTGLPRALWSPPPPVHTRIIHYSQNMYYMGRSQGLLLTP